MNEMKPEDVMRAMECCIVENDKDDCLGCPYSGKRHRGEMCVTHLLEDALALLRERDAEIERLNKERDDARSDCAVAEQNHYKCKKELEEMSDDILDSVRAERDRYKAESEQYQIEMLKRGKEIERLRAECASFEEINEMWVEENNRLKEAIKTARAKAITEFAEKLKEAVKYIPWCEYPPVIECIGKIEEQLKGANDG